MELKDAIALIHPAIAMIVVYPLIGNVINLAWQVRQRRLQNASGGKSKIPPISGQEHLKLGRYLAISVVGITLIALAYSIFIKHILAKQTWIEQPLQVGFIVLMFVATIAALFFLQRASNKLWRGTFATLTGAGLVILGFQEGVFRRDSEWFVSHYYYGIIAALLMIFSLAIVPEIYRDKTNRWRIVHTVLNSIALALFLGQAITGARDLLEIPLSWQEPYIYQCDFANKSCPTATPQP
ncbi:DUF4079 domain-containing protein [Aerosakkonema funiforme]|uniref:DUF4079 domain-containing protein n=2 Tax=Oscillatoriophycideae TaxID=1301283 RepID=A0A926VII0_9CYAN|nr:DUF4079 domain-containing protein [Aerosakkonema funiforme]MBD2184444.1 DUF4079 domain-containing protein [Aerosakkonema funiforme FACHB-1375]